MNDIDLDFAALLVALTVFTGIVWAIDRAFFAKRRAERAAALEASAAGGAEERRVLAEKARREPVIVEYSRSFFPVILAVLVIRSFIAEPFRIPSSSMMPTLLIGDFILVNKFAYGLKIPVLNREIVPIGEPERGDVVVFRFPGEGAHKGQDYIKRVIGLPGDRIAVRNNIVYVNDQPAPQQELGTYVGEGSNAEASGAAIRVEKLPEVDHRILQLKQPRYAGGPTEGTWQVPPGHYFVLGDNRDNSEDSRFWGYVPEGNLVGKAFFIWLNLDMRYVDADWSRIGTIIE